MLDRSFLIESSSKLLVTRTGIKARMSSISGLWFPWPIYVFFEMRFDLGTLHSGERPLPFWATCLKIALTFACFHTSGITFSFNDLSKIILKGNFT